MLAAAYIRKSKVKAQAGDGAISRADQETACQRLALRDGWTDVRPYVDWNRSGDEDKVDRREEWNRMLVDVQAGRVGAVYAKAQDRLMRGVSEWAGFLKVCERHGVKVVTEREGVHVDPGSDDPNLRTRSEMAAVFSGHELRVAKLRARATVNVKKRRGDHLGALP